MIGNFLDELEEIDDQYENGVVFRPRGAFEVDGVVYDPDFVTHTVHPIVDLRWANHDCSDWHPRNTCSFDWGTEGREISGCDAYRWHSGMVYYRSIQFQTPKYGSAE